MRQCRIKVDHQDTWYHCYNRVAGTRLDRPFGNLEKQQFVNILHRVCLLYTVRVVSYQVMSNHFHLLMQVPAQTPDLAEVCRRYKAFHRNKRTLDPESSSGRAWQARVRDVSWFMRHLQHLFTAWYNRTRSLRRRGSLWADRFKHSILETGPAVWACWNYIENNPVRAGMVQDAADYRFCSHGVWHQSGRHPFESILREHVLPMLKNLFGWSDLRTVRDRMDQTLAEKAGGETAGSGPLVVVRRRVRYWVDGLVIGTDGFMRSVMRPHGEPARVGRHRVADLDPIALPSICAWRRLRVAIL